MASEIGQGYTHWDKWANFGTIPCISGISWDSYL